MAYNTEIFEDSLHAKGYVIERVKYSSPGIVKYVLGAIVEGTLVKRAWWNFEGKCFSHKGKALPKYDLPLEQVQKRLTERSLSYDSRRID